MFADNSLSEQDAAVKIQRSYRHHRTFFNALRKAGCVAAHIYIGNSYPIEGLDKYKVRDREQVVLLAPSCFGNVETICQLSNSSGSTPKLFILDHNYEVWMFWARLMALFSLSGAQMPDDFEQRIKSFVRKHKRILDGGGATDEVLNYRVKTDADYINNVISTYGYERVRKIILNATVIRGAWEALHNFIALRYYLKNNNIKNFFVYASNVASYTYENIAYQILKNIELLKPKLTIHASFNPIRHTISKTYLFETYDLSEVFIHLNSNVRREMEAARPVIHEQQRLCFTKITMGLVDLVAANKFDIEINNIPFLISVIFKMAGIKEEVIACKFHNSYHYDKIIFHLCFDYCTTLNIIKSINQWYPELGAGYSRMGENFMYELLPTRLALNATAIQQIVPAIGVFLRENPGIKNFYENVLGAGMKRLRRLFARMGLDLCNSNYFGKALCYLAQSHHAGEAIPYLMTAQTVVEADAANFLQIRVYLTTPVERAEYIAKYLNSIVADSAKVWPRQLNAPDKKTPYTVMFIQNSVLTDSKFLAALEEILVQILNELKSVDITRINLETFKAGYTTTLTASTSTLFNSTSSSFKTPADILKYAKTKPDSVAATVLAQMQKPGP